jgi:aspartyl aminopeptidase
MTSYAQQMVEWINSCHSVFHAAAAVEKELQEAGFLRLYENEPWHLESNRYYYVMRGDTSLIAFKLPEMMTVRSANIVVSHTDSPCLKVKPHAEMKDQNYTRLDVEVYGGALLSTWLDRPLSVAGRVTVRQEGRLVSRLVDFDENLALIPNVAIHQNRQANDGYHWNPQVDLVPMTGLSSEPDWLAKKVAGQLGIEPQDIYGTDLYLYNRQPGYVWGKDNELVSAVRLDNLDSVYTSLQAFKAAYSRNSINVFGTFDNEEIGCRTRQGLASDFLTDVMDRIFASFFYTSADRSAVLANSFLISADAAHAVHPNHPELFDGENGVWLNRGIVIKTSAVQSYINDSVAEAVVRRLCETAEVPYQFFANRSDSRGGSTQAAATPYVLSSKTADIGIAQLAMHSSFETAGARDVEAMVALLSEFYGSTITYEGDAVNIERS